jgi:hypothetical protein
VPDAAPDAPPPCYTPDPVGPASGVSIGAIRWDAWFAEPEVPPIVNRLPFWAHQWFERVPFFATFTDGKWSSANDRQSVVDREIDYAVTRGIDYWAFDYNRFLVRDYETGAYPDITALSGNQRDNYRGGYPLERYLASSHCKKPRFALVVSSDAFDSYLNIWRPGVTTKTRDQVWPIILGDLAAYLARPEQLKTSDGRPIVFMITGSRWGAVWDGDAALAKAKLEELRQAAVGAGAKRPYFVVMDPPSDAADAVTKLGFDGASSYGWNAGLNPSGTGMEVPWSQADFDVDWVARTDVSLGLDVIPPVVSGWDYRPEIPFVSGRDPAGNWYAHATQDQFVNQLDHAIAFVKANPTHATPGAVLIYAWNELAEGGYIVPTLAAGSARLDAIAKYLGKPIPATTPSLAPVLIPIINSHGTGCTDGYGIWIVGANIDPDSVVQLRAAKVGQEDVLATHADLTRGTADGQVSLSFCLGGAAERAAFAGDGVRVSVVNPARPSTSQPFVTRLGN